MMIKIEVSETDGNQDLEAQVNEEEFISEMLNQYGTIGLVFYNRIKDLKAYSKIEKEFFIFPF